MTKPSQLKTFLWFQSGLDEALSFYQATFGDVVVHSRTPSPDGKLFTADFTIFGHEFIGMCVEGGPVFNDSISLSINCDGQDEVDRLWDSITAEGKAGQCGWCVDKWGVSWQVSPFQMRDYLGDPDPVRQQYAWKALRGMTKIQLSDFEPPKN